METTLLGLSKKLRDAGAKQESGLYWLFDDVHPPYLTPMSEPTEGCETVSSFDCRELMMGMPGRIGEFHLAIIKLENTPGFDDMRFEALYLREGESPFVLWHYYDEEPAEALGKLKLWCLEEGHCNE